VAAVKRVVHRQAEILPEEIAQRTFIKPLPMKGDVLLSVKSGGWF
jgi:hypothetical protein